MFEGPEPTPQASIATTPEAEHRKRRQFHVEEPAASSSTSAYDATLVTRSIFCEFTHDFVSDEEPR